MTKRSLTLRVALLLPLLATGVDLARATLMCGPEAQTCLEAAGRGWMGTVAVVLVPLYAFALALVLARTARPPSGRRFGFLGLWGLGTAAVGAVCAGQLALAALLGGGDGLGGGPLELTALCVAAGALLALAMRARDAVADLHPGAPRRLLTVAVAIIDSRAPALAAPRPAAAPARGRGPPAA